MKIFVKPKEGLKVRDPATKNHLPQAGAEVEQSPYWAKRIADKSVELAKAEEKNSNKKDK